MALLREDEPWPLVFPTRLSLDSTLSGDVLKNAQTGQQYSMRAFQNGGHLQWVFQFEKQT